MNKKVVFIMVVISYFFIPMTVYGQNPEPVTPSSVTGRALPLPLEQGRRKINISWNASSSGSVTNYCIYYKETSSPTTGSALSDQPCYSPDTTINVGNTTEYYISNLSYEKWYIIQITADTTNNCPTCTITNTGAGNQMSNPSPLKSFGVYIPKSTLKWEEYTD